VSFVRSQRLFPSAGCFGFCLTWSNRGHLLYCLWPHVVVLNSHFGVRSFLPSRQREALMRLSSKKGGGRYFRISVCLFLFAFVLCRSIWISKVELPLDWLRELHEPLLSFKPAINFIAPWFGLAPKPSQYFSRFGLGSEDFRCLKCGPRAICWIQKFQRALVGSSSTARVVAVLFDGVSDVRLDFRHRLYKNGDSESCHTISELRYSSCSGVMVVSCAQRRKSLLALLDPPIGFVLGWFFEKDSCFHFRCCHQDSFPASSLRLLDSRSLFRALGFPSANCNELLLVARVALQL